MNFGEAIVVKNLDGKILSPSELARHFVGGNAMIVALQKKCPHPNMPEPKFVGYREEVVNYDLYMQTMFVMKPNANFKTSKKVDANDDIHVANAVRAASRKKLIQRFWRRLGAA